MKIDKRTIYFKVKELLNGIDKKVITLDELKSLISMYVGGTPSTVENAMRIMAMTNLIKDIGNFRFEILQN